GYGRGGYSSSGNYASMGGSLGNYLSSAMSYTAHKDRETPVTMHSEAHTYFSAQPFLTGIPTKWMNNREELMPLIEETFEKRTGAKFPNDILVHICNDEDFAKGFGPGCTDSIRGFCQNRFGKAVSDVFVRHGDLAEVMLVLGHEIGHAMTAPLRDQRDEEAKAFAFSLAWMETIRDHNIADLRNSFHFQPAQNGLHDVAFNFVLHIIKTGTDAITTFMNICAGTTSITHTLEQIIIR
ncbi:MAG: hypothetical protein AABY01_00780, partial [Nanoarchaeota archaeon]